MSDNGGERPPTGEVVPPGPGLVRLRMELAYDGGSYRGFAANPGVVTVAGTLIEVLEQVLGQPVALSCAGRTDAGVHGWGQVVSFDAHEIGLDLPQLQAALNSLCGPTIAVRSIERAEPTFDARRSATSRTYHYTILNRAVPDPFLASITWRIGAPLDVPEMNRAAASFVGVHDFSSFCRRKTVVGHDGREVEASRVRRVLAAEWTPVGADRLQFEISANAFCQQMVRSLVGTLVDVGLGKRSADAMPTILEARDRDQAGQLAPPHGLVLHTVGYTP